MEVIAIGAILGWLVGIWWEQHRLKRRARVAAATAAERDAAALAKIAAASREHLGLMVLRGARFRFMEPPIAGNRDEWIDMAFGEAIYLMTEDRLPRAAIQARFQAALVRWTAWLDTQRD